MRKKIYLAAIVLVTLIFWCILIFQISLFTTSYWFWKLHITKLPNIAVAVPMLVLTGCVIYLVLKRWDRVAVNLMLLVLLGTALQIGIAFMEGRGVDALRDRMVYSGHAEFAKIAAGNLGLSTVARDYEQLVPRTGIYPRTKPPGQLLFYMITQKLAGIIYPTATPRDRFYGTATFASYFYPFVSCLVIIPLFFISTQFLDGKAAFFPALLYLFVPNVVLITLHLDQTVYPLLFALCFWLATLATHRSRFLPAFAAGACFYLAIYVSFSLLPVLPFSIGFVLLSAWNHRKEGSAVALRRIAIPAAAFVLGFILLWVLGWWILNYDLITRYRNAMSFHVFLKDWSPGLNEPLFFAFFNFFEFAWWIGPPLACFFFGSVVDSFSAIGARTLTVAEQVSLLCSGLVLLVGFFGKTKGEVGRLWIFMVPFVCLSVAVALVRWFPRKTERYLLLTIVLQAATIMIIKYYQDLHSREF